MEKYILQTQILNNSKEKLYILNIIIIYIYVSLSWHT